jgi:hypothetical protein
MIALIILPLQLHIPSVCPLKLRAHHSRSLAEAFLDRVNRLKRAFSLPPHTHCRSHLAQHLFPTLLLLDQVSNGKTKRTSPLARQRPGSTASSSELQSGALEFL